MSTIYKNNGNYWYFQTYIIQSDGRRVRKQISLHTTDQSVAEQAKVEWDRKVAAGLFMSPRFLFEDVVEEHLKKRRWLVEHGRLNENTLRSDEGSFEQFSKFLKTLPQPLYLDHFDGESGRKIIQEYIEYRGRHKISSNTIRRDLRHVSVMFSSLQEASASENGPRIDVNPFVNAHLPPPIKRQDFPEQSDWLILRDYLRNWVSTKPYDCFKTIIHFQIESGCRISEVLNLKWRQGIEERTRSRGRSFSYLSEDSRLWHIYSKRRPRTIPLNKLGYSIPNIPRRSDAIYVFENPHTQRPYLASSAARMFSRLLDEVFTDKNGKSTLKRHFTTHGVRHGFCTNCLDEGIPIYNVGQLVGHGTAEMTELYSHINVDSLKTTLDKIQDNWNIPQKLTTRNPKTKSSKRLPKGRSLKK